MVSVRLQRREYPVMMGTILCRTDPLLTVSTGLCQIAVIRSTSMQYLVLALRAR